MRWFLLSLCLVLFAPAAMASNVIVTIKPLHSLAAMIMEGSRSEPILLVDSSQSMHNFSLKPSQVAQIHNADSVILISPHFEMFMEAVLDAAPKNLHRIIMAEQKNITLLPTRRGQSFEVNQQKHTLIEDANDLHLWSSPDNAKVMLNIIATELIRIDPTQQMLYEANLKRALKKVDALDAKLKSRLGKLKDRHFVTFHDATQYFEHAYGLQSAGSLTLHPERGTSAAHIAEIQQKIRDAKAACVFREPQFDDKIVTQLLQGSDITSQTIDPEASQLPPSPLLYFELMEGLAHSFETCLG